MRLLQHSAVGLFATITLCSVDAQTMLPELRRQPVKGAPLICGRKIEQFVLLQNVDFTPTDHYSADPLHGFPKGLFLPVSEDAYGVFYQASNGAVIGRPYPPYEHENATGGIYVSKTKPGLAYGYLGDARKPASQLSVMSERLRQDVLAKFLIGHAAPPREKVTVERSLLVSLWLVAWPGFGDRL